MPRQWVNAVYYPSWKIYKGHAPSELQVQSITHVFYAFARVNADGTLHLLDEKADTQLNVDGEQGCLAAMAKLKRHNPNIKTLLSVGGGSGSANFPAIAASFRGRESFARTAREFVERFELDGIDIDWEHPKTPSQGDDFIHLLRATRVALPSPKYQLTTALPMGQYCLKHINLPAAAQELDLLNLMGYDFAGTWTQLSGHHSQLFPPQGDIPPSLRMSCYSGVEYVLSHGFPAKKLVLGIPAYARFFQGATGPGQPFHGSGELDYEDLPPEWIEKAQIDQVLGAAYYVDCEEKGFMSYDVPSTVRMKADFVRKMDLAGLFYWTGIGDTKGPNSLVASGYHALNGTQV